MDFGDNAYCRLCAELKPSSKLINLVSDHTQREEIAEKLARLNAGTDPGDFSQDILPKTVCLVCTNSLDRAFQFIIGVEKAQCVLNNLLSTQKINRESRESSCDENFTYEYHSPEEVKDGVKEESDTEDIKCSEKLLKQGVQVKRRGRNKLKNDNCGNEITSSDEKNVTCEPPGDIKDDVKQDSNKKKLRKLGVPVEKRSGKKLKSKDISKGSGLDAIPLSQLKLTWADYIWKCSHCETQFPNIDELKTHSMQYHERCNAFRCTDCPSRKSILARFLTHVTLHRKYLKMSCYKCHTKFSKPLEARAHKSVHNNSKHMCRGCNTTFLNQEDLNQHCKLYYKANRTPPIQQSIPAKQNMTNSLSCSVCKKTFKGNSSLKSHLLIHTDRKRDHICDKCGKCFWSKEILAGHMILHDGLKYRCEICKATFKTPIQLYNHIGVHDNKKPFACEQCGRCFRLLRHLTAHSIIHTDAMPYACSYCDKRFRFKCILMTHINQHTGVKPYSCEFCQHRFTNWPNYNKHMKGRHGMDMSKTKRTPNGIFHVDQTTGKVITHSETKEIIEWKQKIKQRRFVELKTNVKINDTSKKT